ncbi:hypothetical protein PR048_031174 [Dryococelus australis]|uniref:Uncharacterized protein n=1 Tax=Dryococelus australis TaxID=614101 RepID=A0ABQ9G7N0_9NEOP|nr:hypothetical protein PR048_031174 [Dryococelus australis]
MLIRTGSQDDLWWQGGNLGNSAGKREKVTFLYAKSNVLDGKKGKKGEFLHLQSSARRQGGEKREIPEKTRRPTASSGTIPTCGNPVTRPGIEPGSPWWEASVLIAQPPPMPAQSSPSTVTAGYQCAIDIGIFVHTTVQSSLQVNDDVYSSALGNPAPINEHFTIVCPNHVEFIQKGSDFTSMQQPMEKRRCLLYVQIAIEWEGTCLRLTLLRVQRRAIAFYFTFLGSETPESTTQWSLSYVFIGCCPTPGSYGIRKVFPCKSGIGSQACRADLINCEPIAKFGSPLVDGRPILDSIKYKVVSGVVRTNRTMVSFNTDTNRTGVPAVVDIGDSFDSSLLPGPLLIYPSSLFLTIVRNYESTALQAALQASGVREGKYVYMFRVDVKHMYSEITFAIGSQFVRPALNASEPITDLQGNILRIPKLPEAPLSAFPHSLAPLHKCPTGPLLKDSPCISYAEYYQHIQTQRAQLCAFRTSSEVKHQNVRAGEKREISEKTSQPAARAQIRDPPRRESNPVRPGGRQALQPNRLKPGYPMYKHRRDTRIPRNVRWSRVPELPISTYLPMHPPAAEQGAKEGGGQKEGGDDYQDRPEAPSQPLRLFTGYVECCPVLHTINGHAPVLTTLTPPRDNHEENLRPRPSSSASNLATTRPEAMEQYGRHYRPVYNCAIPICALGEGWVDWYTSVGMKGRGETEDPREGPPTNGIARQSSHMRKSGVSRPGIEPGSPRWETSRLTAHPPQPHLTSRLGHVHAHRCNSENTLNSPYEDHDELKTTSARDVLNVETKKLKGGGYIPFFGRVDATWSALARTWSIGIPDTWKLLSRTFEPGRISAVCVGDSPQKAVCPRTPLEEFICVINVTYLLDLSKEIGHSTADLILLAQEFSGAWKIYFWLMVEVGQAHSQLEFSLSLNNNDKIDVKHVYTEIDFVIGSQFITHVLDDSEPIADLQGNKNGKESAMAFVGDLFQHSSGVISENHGKHKSGWPDRESNPGPPECESSELPMRHLARLYVYCGQISKMRAQLSIDPEGCVADNKRPYRAQPLPLSTLKCASCYDHRLKMISAELRLLRRFPHIEPLIASSLRLDLNILVHNYKIDVVIGSVFLLGDIFMPGQANENLVTTTLAIRDSSRADTAESRRSRADTAESRRSRADTAESRRSRADVAELRRSRADTAESCRSRADVAESRRSRADQRNIHTILPELYSGIVVEELDKCKICVISWLHNEHHRPKHSSQGNLQIPAKYESIFSGHDFLVSDERNEYSIATPEKSQTDGSVVIQRDLENDLPSSKANLKECAWPKAWDMSDYHFITIQRTNTERVNQMSVFTKEERCEKRTAPKKVHMKQSIQRIHKVKRGYSVPFANFSVIPCAPAMKVEHIWESLLLLERTLLDTMNHVQPITNLLRNQGTNHVLPVSGGKLVHQPMNN